MRRVIVCGSRDPWRKLGVSRGWVCERLYEAFDVRSRNDTVIVHGGAPGVDTIASEAAETWGLKTEPHRAETERYGSPAAFHIRNQAMADAGADLLVAFPGGNGTADMVRRARKAGIHVREVRIEDTP